MSLELSRAPGLAPAVGVLGSAGRADAQTDLLGEDGGCLRDIGDEHGRGISDAEADADADPDIDDPGLRDRGCGCRAAVGGPADGTGVAVPLLLAGGTAALRRGRGLGR